MSNVESVWGFLNRVPFWAWLLIAVAVVVACAGVAWVVIGWMVDGDYGDF